MSSKNQIIKGLGAHHVAVQTRNWDESLKLYRDVLGMEIIAQFEGASPKRKIILLDMGDGTHIELFDVHENSPKPEDQSINDPIIHFAFTTDDTVAATEIVRNEGYEITIEPKKVNLDGIDVTLSFFKGPSGEVLEFFQVH